MVFLDETQEEGMSELTRCNFCSLRVMKILAKESGLKVTVLKDASWGLGGSNVYVHPAGVDVRKLVEGERVKYRGAWMQEIGKSCEC